jgi:hypothetical protein
MNQIDLGLARPRMSEDCRCAFRYLLSQFCLDQIDRTRLGIHWPDIDENNIDDSTAFLVAFCRSERATPRSTTSGIPRALSEDLILPVPRSLPCGNTIGKANAIATVYSFARIFRAMSFNAMRIKLFRRRAGLTITPWFQCRELILVFVFFTPVVGFPPQMTLVFISGTRRPYLERKLLTDGCIEPRLYERTGLNKGNQSSA